MVSKIRTTPVETVDVGDLATFTWKEGDVTRSAYARVADVKRYGRTRIFHSESGAEICRFDLDHPSRVQVVMIERYTPAPPTLFDMVGS